MSLINQVLRDLDKRHADTAAAPSAVKPSHRPSPNALRRAARWGMGAAITAVAIVGGALAQGSIEWPGHAVAVATAAPVATMPAQAKVSVSATPVEAPAAAAPTDAATPRATAELQLDRHLADRPESLALATPTMRANTSIAPRHEAAPRASRTADLPASAVMASVSKPEARIDKHMAARTPQERAEAHYQRGVTAHQAGQINDSADAFAAALREDPRYAPARHAQAGVLIGQSRLDEALALLQEGIALTPQQPTLALMLARLQAERQDLAAAADTLKTASPNAANNAEYLGFYAAILQRANRHAEASEQFSTALRLSPANGVWWMGLGISLEANRQTGAAREAFTRAKTTGTLPPEAGQYVEMKLRQLM